MKPIVLNINDVEVSPVPTSYVCYGLGSCVGLFIADRVTGIVGGAHIPMADDHPAQSFLSARSMIKAMLAGFEQFGSDLKSLRAKLTGGAMLFDVSLNVGSRTTEAVIQFLIDHKIFIASKDVGGRFSRTALFDGETGDLFVSTSEQRKYII